MPGPRGTRRQAVEMIGWTLDSENVEGFEDAGIGVGDRPHEPNEQILGVPLTTTRDDLMASIIHDDVRLVAVAGSEGMLTLAFTDVVDSTGLAASVGDAAHAELMTAHEVAIRRAAESHGGSVVKVLGDGAMLAFESARASLRAAVEIRRSSSAAGLPPWCRPGRPGGNRRG